MGHGAIIHGGYDSETSNGGAVPEPVSAERQGRDGNAVALVIPGRFRAIPGDSGQWCLTGPPTPGWLGSVSIPPKAVVPFEVVWPAW